MLEKIIIFTDSVVASITPILNKIVAATLIIFLGFAVGRLLGKFVFKILRDARVDKGGKKVLQKEYPLAKILSSTISYSIYAGAIFFALSTIGLANVAIGFAVFCFVVVIGISILIGVRDFLPNFLARKEVQKKVTIHKRTTIKGISGIVEKIGIVETQVRTKKGELFAIPNKEVVK